MQGKEETIMVVCRHCTKAQFKSSYASVLVLDGHDNVMKTVTELESRQIPCVSAICPKCERISVLSDGSIDSLLRTVYMWTKTREWIDVGWQASSAAKAESRD